MAATVPLHRQVMQDLKTRIEVGRLPAGARMPTERALSDEFGVSRVTVRQALKALEETGLVESGNGVRWIRRRESGPIEEGLGGLVSFSELGLSHGLAASARVLTFVTRPASLDEADVLGVAPGSAVHELLRLRFLDDVPILVDHSLVPEAIAPGLAAIDFTTASLYQTLGNLYGRQPVKAECAIEACRVDGENAELLCLRPGDSVLEIVQSSFDAHGNVVHWCRSVYRGDRYRFRAVLESGRGAQMSRRSRAESLSGSSIRTHLSGPAQ